MTECNTCGNMGYTIEINDEGVEYIESCFKCFVEAQEEEAHRMNHCIEDDRGYHEYEYGGHRCNHCNHLHPSLKGAAA